VLRGGYSTDEVIAGEVPEVRDEAGRVIENLLVRKRWVYRLAPYFDYGWGGTTHVNARARRLAERADVMRDGGLFGDALESWAYDVSVFPSFGYNGANLGGDPEDVDGGGRTIFRNNQHTKRLSDPVAASELIAFVSAYGENTFPGGDGERVEGYFKAAPAPLGFPAWDETVRSDEFRHVHPRYGGSAVVGFVDGHAGTLTDEQTRDRRFWSDYARRRNLPDWDPAVPAR
jgi:prepilin-type processing-associated H-X9-DG protein